MSDRTHTQWRQKRRRARRQSSSLLRQRLRLCEDTIRRLRELVNELKVENRTLRQQQRVVVCVPEEECLLIEEERRLENRGYFNLRNVNLSDVLDDNAQ